MLVRNPSEWGLADKRRANIPRRYKGAGARVVCPHGPLGVGSAYE